MSQSYPIPVSQLIEYVPHRLPAVWIDEVLSASKCRVRVKDAPYMDGAYVRQSSFIEFMAQSYGYVVAAEALIRKEKNITKYKRAYLVALKDIEFPSNLHVPIGMSLIIEVTKTHELGPILIVEGKVSVEGNGTCLAQGQIKVFAE